MDRSHRADHHADDDTGSLAPPYSARHDKRLALPAPPHQPGHVRGHHRVLRPPKTKFRQNFSDADHRDLGLVDLESDAVSIQHHVQA